MLEKYIPIDTLDVVGNPTMQKYYPEHFNKIAGIAGPVEDFLATLPPDPDLIYLVINAMGAGEFYSSNRNGDYFPEKALDQYHPSFVTGAKVYRHHKNKPTDKSYGNVLFSYYNPTMHRVELVLTINRKLAPDLALRLDNDEYLPFSMGVKVPYDVCSICQHQSKTTAQYCEHLKRPNLNSVDPSTGKKNYAINDHRLRFFDISVVRINADRTAFTMKKVAEAVEAVRKEATIVKKLPAVTVAQASTPLELLDRVTQKNMPESLVEEVSKVAELGTMLRTLLGMRALPTKMDFQNLVLQGSKRDELAKYLNRRGKIFPNTDGPVNIDIPKSFNYGIAEQIRLIHPEMIRSKPVIIARIIRMQKTTPESVIHGIPELNKVAALYQWYIHAFNNEKIDHGPLIKNAELMKLLYPKYAMYQKEASLLTYNADAPGTFLSPVDPTVEPKGIDLPTNRFTTFMIEKKGPSLDRIIEDILMNNSSFINGLYENIT